MGTGDETRGEKGEDEGRKEGRKEGRSRRISEKERRFVPEEQGHEWQTGRGLPFAV